MGLEAHACSLRIFVMLHVSDAVAEQLKLLGGIISLTFRPTYKVVWPNAARFLWSYQNTNQISSRPISGYVSCEPHSK